MTTALEGVEVSASRPGRSLPPGKTRYPLYRKLGGPQGRSEHVRKISTPPGFDPRTDQPVTTCNLRVTIMDFFHIVIGSVAPEISSWKFYEPVFRSRHACFYCDFLRRRTGSLL